MTARGILKLLYNRALQAHYKCKHDARHVKIPRKQCSSIMHAVAFDTVVPVLIERTKILAGNYTFSIPDSAIPFNVYVNASGSVFSTKIDTFHERLFKGNFLYISVTYIIEEIKRKNEFVTISIYNKRSTKDSSILHAFASIPSKGRMFESHDTLVRWAKETSIVKGHINSVNVAFGTVEKVSAFLDMPAEKQHAFARKKISSSLMLFVPVNG